MKYKANSRRRALEYEKDLIEKWKNNKTFEKSIAIRDESNSYVFYDGPPFITGSPHVGTLLSSIVKDAVPRYQTMRGKRVERVWGWDCHGLPAENFVEKKLGINSRQEIGTKVSLEDYIVTARESMVQTSGLWEGTIDRIGRWVDFKGGYKTMDKDYMESVWWAFKTLYEKGKIYEGERVLMYDTQWATPLSKAEVTMDAGAYIEVTDPSVYVKFKLSGKNENRYMVAWTTTPWTLPGNTALAVNQKIEYVEVKVGEEVFIIAKGALERVLKDDKNKAIEYKVIGSVKAKDLIGLEYDPIFGSRGKNAHKIWHADYVSTESGSGIVHLAPAYGEEDFELAQLNNIPIVHVLDEYGIYTETDFKGQDVWQSNKLVAKSLHEQGIVWRIEYIRHEYPHNPRTGHRLMYRAHPSWFLDIENQRQEMLEQNSQHINWFPEHIKHGRFEKTIEQAPDWNLSRDRFWATAMPVWKGVDKAGKEHVKVIGSYQELKDLSGVELEDYHRPWVDDITFELDGVTYKRIDKVLDCWFESGSMPFAQFHYPFENIEKFEKNFPGDFIVEYVGQVRAWFYYVHALSVALFGHNAFRNVIVTGNVAGNDGRKMSKSLGNFTDPNQLMDAYSADSLRFLLLSSPLLSGEDFALQDKEVGDIARKLTMIWNMYDFFTMYAEVDGWQYKDELKDPFADVTNPLDIWIISRLHQLIDEVTRHMDGYDIPSATKLILPFIDDASNWYVRRSRRRFWKSGDDIDKNNAYQTLHYVLVQIAKVIAPFAPFMAEELYQKMTGSESVHLVDWPVGGRVDDVVISEMSEVREYVTAGLSLRAVNRLKVRQPLASVTVKNNGQFVDYADVLLEELNVKKMLIGKEFSLDLKVTEILKREGLMRELVRNIQNARKEIGLQVDDRIDLAIETTEAELSVAIQEHTEIIQQETLAVSMNTQVDLPLVADVTVDGFKAKIYINKHK